MINHFARAPHVEGVGPVLPSAPNAALLIDFDNVTMGIRSDLSKELKTLLNSDMIKGKVTVQRAYADWRRYPQYIVPLSEASVDLIFAPAYGSSKKNATDIRMAIDGMELVFIRPEIGTYILLTGDSDFSSLVLKLEGIWQVCDRRRHPGIQFGYPGAELRRVLFLFVDHPGFRRLRPGTRASLSTPGSSWRRPRGRCSSAAT